jgi:1-acyl-sn-glycerol-3-phosphate acyltransferase
MIKRFRKAFYGFWFRVFGWKVKGQLPPDKKFVITVAPHTSNLDFPIGVAARNILHLKSHFLAKKSLFDIPLVGWLFKLLGGHPVDRKKKMNLVDQVVELFNQHEEFVMTVTPEGTRSYSPKWKTGFYYIALKAKVPIVMIGFDYGTKTVEVREPFHPTGDVEQDLEMMKAYYRTIKGYHPEKGVL